MQDYQQEKHEQQCEIRCLHFSLVLSNFKLAQFKPPYPLLPWHLLCLLVCSQPRLL